MEPYTRLLLVACITAVLTDPICKLAAEMAAYAVSHPGSGANMNPAAHLPKHAFHVHAPPVVASVVFAHVADVKRKSQSSTCPLANDANAKNKKSKQYMRFCIFFSDS